MPKDFHTCLKLLRQGLWKPTRGSSVSYVSIEVVEFLLLFLKKKGRENLSKWRAIGRSYRKELHDGTMAFCQEI